MSVTDCSQVPIPLLDPPIPVQLLVRKSHKGPTSTKACLNLDVCRGHDGSVELWMTATFPKISFAESICVNGARILNVEHSSPASVHVNMAIPNASEPAFWVAFSKEGQPNSWRVSLEFYSVQDLEQIKEILFCPMKEYADMLSPKARPLVFTAPDPAESDAITGGQKTQIFRVAQAVVPRLVPAIKVLCQGAESFGPVFSAVTSILEQIQEVWAANKSSREIDKRLYNKCCSALQWLGPAFTAAVNHEVHRPKLEPLLKDLRDILAEAELYLAHCSKAGWCRAVFQSRDRLSAAECVIQKFEEFMETVKVAALSMIIEMYTQRPRS